MSDDEVLHGGVANAGGVVRHDGEVSRPSNPHSTSIHEYLRQLQEVPFDGAPVPVGIDAEGRERLRYIDGEVAIPPYPDWVQTDGALISLTRLLCQFHDASGEVDTTGMTWSAEMADPVGGALVCHNDVCLENVVFRDGEAIALLDFDFAAPGRRSHDVAAFARMCVPIDDPLSAERLGWRSADRPARLRLVCDSYGLDGPERLEVLESLDTTIAAGGEFVLRHVEAGEAGFIAMWNEMGGMERYDRRRTWWADHRPQFESALGLRTPEARPGRRPRSR